MWPWEHVLFAYVFYSLFVHLWYRSSPDEWPVVTLVLASFVPDIVDKPLAWQFGLFETGWALAHSVFVAVPVSLFVYTIARRYDRDREGLAFTFGYLLHLVGDVLPASLSRGQLSLSPILWPVGNPTVAHQHGSFIESVNRLLTNYVAQLLSLDVTPVVALQTGSVLVGFGLWIFDGYPGLRLAMEPVRWGERQSQNKTKGR